MLINYKDNIQSSENKIKEHVIKEIIQSVPNLILSLDFGEKGLIENRFLLDSSTYWTKDIIIMMLHRVGSDEGIEQNFLDKIKDIPNKSKLFFAGGIRNLSDIDYLKRQGFSGVLVATALHNGAISKDDLEQFYKD